MSSDGFGKPVCEINPWMIVERDFRAEENEVRESIFSLSNEYMGTRGNFEEGFSGKTLPGCYIGGIYVSEQQIYPWQRPSDPSFLNFITNTVNWLGIQVSIGEETFSMSESNYEGYERRLDMTTGLLTRELTFNTSSGASTRLRWERLISHADPHICAIRLNVTALNHTEPVRVLLSLDGRVGNQVFAVGTEHSRMVSQHAEDEDATLATNYRTTGQYTLHRMRVTADIPDVNRGHILDDKFSAIELSFVPKACTKYTIDKLVSVWTSRDMGYPHGLIPKGSDVRVEPEQEDRIVDLMAASSKKNLDHYRPGGHEAIRSDHIKCLERIWENQDIEIVGDAPAQQGIRYCIFQLSSAYLGRDGYLNIAPKGYTGENYNGRTFWDSESYCFPFYLFTNLDAAKSLLEYRYNALDAARDRARELNYDGAVYPMTTLDGTEDCPLWEFALGEVHINSIIAYVIFLYTHISGDADYLYTKGIDVLVEVSRFWASRVAYVPYRNGYAINCVMGPNEHEQSISNNWYTNYLAKWVLEYTGSVLDEMAECVPRLFSDTVERLDLLRIERSRWQDVADNIILNYDEQMGIFVENDTFLSRDPFHRELLDENRDIPIERKWSVEKYQKVQNLKQPDVLLAIFLFRHRFTQKEKAVNYRFYEQRCVHGSSLSPGIHSILASEIGRHHQAYEYYLYASRIDLDNRNNNTQEGLHISSMAGTWLNIVAGFGGMAYTGDSLSFTPTLPHGWTRYSFKLRYRDSLIQVGVDRENVSFKIISGSDVDIKLYGRDVHVSKEECFYQTPERCNITPKLRAAVFNLDAILSTGGNLLRDLMAERSCVCFDRSVYEELERDPSMSASVHLSDLADALATMRESGIRVAVYPGNESNGIPDLSEIGEMFDAIGDDAPSACRKLSEPFENCVAVENSLDGIRRLSGMGMKTIGVGDKTVLHAADYTVLSAKYISLELMKSLF